uniref:Uncharacterized protein n=1 Tax=Toxoplasma gondii COUG TaxID=1074873 RepID=A0A2G8XVN2_TOXGO|nr:hypothetical protein TGCOUG_221415 [Toxoplasma gondii COUG]
MLGLTKYVRMVRFQCGCCNGEATEIPNLEAEENRCRHGINSCFLRGSSWMTKGTAVAERSDLSGVLSVLFLTTKLQDFATTANGFLVT